MEKQAVVRSDVFHYHLGHRRRSTWWPSAILLGGLIILLLTQQRLLPGRWFPLQRHTASQRGGTTKPFDWETAPTFRHLEYRPCYEDDGDYQCARLELPMDHWNGTTNATISLAVIRKPAVVPITDPRYGGAVLLNPGGPGGSGVGFLKRAYEHVRATIDDTKGMVYDLISFDPRGVNLSKPAVRCISDPGFDQSWQLRTLEQGVFGVSDAAFGRLWSMATARSRSCSLPSPEEECADIKNYMTTASVARDMLEVVEKHGEWREREAKRILGTSFCGSGSAETTESTMRIPETLTYRPDEEKILYWGFSYGSYIGVTFAAMFPDRVHRLIVDGVVDAYDYVQTLWTDNLVDTEKGINQFYHHCARAGYPACVLANERGMTTTQDVSDRVLSIMNSLYHHPLPVLGPYPEVIGYSDVKQAIFSGLYTPIQSFPLIAKLLADIERGDGSNFATMLRPSHTFRCPVQPSTNSVPLSHDAFMAIACTDGDDQSFVNRTFFKSYWEELARLSPSVGPIWATLRLQCVHYRTRAPHRFEGPWVANISHPLLFIGNAADPVTPGVNAKKMAKGFEGAVALIQDSAGHCSISTYSNCTESYIRRYFQTGDLPPEKVVCSADDIPFGPGPEDDVKMTVERLEGRRRSADFGRALHASGGGFMRGSGGGKAMDEWLA